MTTFLSEIVWMRSFEIVNTRLLKISPRRSPISTLWPIRLRGDNCRRLGASRSKGQEYSQPDVNEESEPVIAAQKEKCQSLEDEKYRNHTCQSRSRQVLHGCFAHGNVFQCMCKG